MKSASTWVVFDLDDTLYLERDYVRSGFRFIGQEVEKRFGVLGFSDVAWEMFLEGRRGNIFDRALEKLGVPLIPELIPELVNLYRGHAPEISLAQDGLRCLTQLYGSCALALITDGPRICQQNKIDALALQSWIPARILTGAWGPHFYKPHPRAFEAIQAQARVPPSRLIYVADNPLKDFSAPKQLGWRTCRIRREQGLHAQLENKPVQPDLELTDLVSLPDFVSQF